MSDTDPIEAVIEAVRTLADQSKLGQDARNRVHEALDRAVTDPADQGDTWDQATLETMDHDELRSIAAGYDDVNGNASTEDLIEALEGRPVR
jgi:hypothetical protein